MVSITGLMKRHARLFMLSVLIIQFAAILVVLVIAWQSMLSADVIEQSLQRHVDQRLIDRSLASVVADALHGQTIGLWIAVTALSLGAFFHTWLILRREKPAGNRK